MLEGTKVVEMVKARHLGVNPNFTYVDKVGVTQTTTFVKPLTEEGIKFMRDYVGNSFTVGENTYLISEKRGKYAAFLATTKTGDDAAALL